MGHRSIIEVSFQRSRIDRIPLDDLSGTILSLIIGLPQIHWSFVYDKNENEFRFDDEPIKQELQDFPLFEPAFVGFLRNSLQEGIA